MKTRPGNQNRRSRSAPSRLDLSAIDALGIKRLMTDSRQIRRGDTFVAYPGATSDGRDFIPQALGNGAAGVLWESRGFAWNPAWNVPNLGVPDLRRRAGEIASHIYGQPSARLWVVGVTGTNGKTSCSQWIAQSLGRTGRKCAVIGTLGSGFPGALEATGNTTPDAVWLQASLMSFLRCGARAACMEVSSHGLEQHRLSGVKFDVALFTNISRDHLDYHGTMRRYRAAKARLFGWPSLKYAVLNLDDGFGVELASRAGGARVVGYGFARDRIPRRNADRMLSVQGRNLRVHTGGISFDVTTPWGAASLSSRLIGGFNAANLLGSLATLLASDVSLEESIRALQRVKAVPGRTERYGGGSRPLVIIDYAHTPDALEKILIALRELLPASRLEGPSSRVQTKRSLRSNSEPGTRNPELICVFGCGGERDRGKRPLMGSIAAALADHVVITSDNPRSEDPQAIIRDIARGVRGAHATIEPDRSRAIRLAIGMAHRGDVVLVAGKGHERYQEVRGVRYPFSDATAVTAALRAAAG